MLYLNDVFEYQGQLYRLLYAIDSNDAAWIIRIDVRSGMPMQVAWGLIRALQARRIAPDNVSDVLPTPAMEKTKRKALLRLGGIQSQVPRLFDPEQRSLIVAERALAAGTSKAAIYRDLRRWWQGGQTPSALLGKYANCGNRLGQVTAKRGRQCESGAETYQLCREDESKLNDAIKTRYLRDARVSLVAAYQDLIARHYALDDGNGTPHIRPAGERPSFRQFAYFLNTRYTLEARLRKRLGEKDFEREARSITSNVLEDCMGVGHYYECDATIADVFLVADDNINEIIGKPTIYLIVDRKSRLIVGFYVGLENPSWTSAGLAILSISQDKVSLCESYGVQSTEADWPAHSVFPQQMLADQGELKNRLTAQVTEATGASFAYVPSKRGDWKPIVESAFKTTRVALQSELPGFDPPENAKRRQGKHYEQDACLTLRDFTAIVLNLIVQHNRTPMRHYELSTKEIGDKVLPSPIEIWNHNIKTRAGSLRRFDEESIRLSVMPCQEATVTERGIQLNGCFYTSPHAVARGWMVSARRARFKVTASYTLGLVDKIFVHDPKVRGLVHECSLTPASEKFRGRSVAEVTAINRIAKNLHPDMGTMVLQARANRNAAFAQIANQAKERLKSRGKMASRSSRRADTKEARALALSTERSERLVEPSSSASVSPAGVISLVPSIKQATDDSQAKNPGAQVSTGLTLQQRLKAARITKTEPQSQP